MVLFQLTFSFLYIYTLFLVKKFQFQLNKLFLNEFLIYVGEKSENRESL